MQLIAFHLNHLVYISELFEAKGAISSFSENVEVVFVYLYFIDEGLELLVDREHLEVVIECSFLVLFVVHVVYNQMS